MNGIPRTLPNDSEDVVWALETAESLWKRGERVDAVVWLRRAAQAAGETEDIKRAASLANAAAELGDWIASNSVAGGGAGGGSGGAGAGAAASSRKGGGQSHSSLQALDALLDGPISRDGSDVFVLSTNDVEIVSAKDFEAGFGSPRASRDSAEPPERVSVSENEVMTISSHAPDVELVEEGELIIEGVDGIDGIDDEQTPHPTTPPPARQPSIQDDQPTPVARGLKSPLPAPVPSAAQAHAGMLDPWADGERKSAPGAAPAPKPRSPSRAGFEEEEVVTSARISRAQPLVPDGVPERPEISGARSRISVPLAPKAPDFRGRPKAPIPSAPPMPPSAEEEEETTTYRQINPRVSKGPSMPSTPSARSMPAARTVSSAKVSAHVSPQAAPSRVPAPSPSPPPAHASPPPPSPPPRPAPAPKPPASAPRAPAAAPVASAKPPVEDALPALDLLELVDAVVAPPPPSILPTSDLKPSAAPTPRPPTASIPASARPTAPPPGSVMPMGAMPSAPPTRPRAGSTLLDLESIEALGDLPDDAREAFGLAATMHTIDLEEEVSHFALALVVEGLIDVAATIVEAPAMRLEKNAVLRSRGTLTPGVPLRLLGASPKAIVASWDDAAVAAAFRTCPWVEEDLRAVADRVQARVGVTMGPLGERFDLSLREHLTSKLTLKNLAPGETLVAEGKPVGVILVGIGEIAIKKKTGERSGTMRPGDFVFPTQTLSHGKAPEDAIAGEGGAVVFIGDRATAQELLMTFPPLLEVLATL